MVHYRSKVQLLEDGFDFLIELYAIEKDEEVQNSFNQADLILMPLVLEWMVSLFR